MTCVFPVLTSLAVAVCAMSMPASYATQSASWQVQDLTKGAVQLDALDESPAKVTFTFKNASNKKITAYLICFSHGGAFTACHHNDWYLNEGDGLAPGTSDRVVISTEEAAQYTNRTVEVSAVIFEDGASEGSYSKIESIELKRLGRALETRRLGLAFSSVDSELADAELDRLAARIGPLPKAEPKFFAEFSQMEIPGLDIPDLHRLSRPSQESFVSGALGARHEARLAIEELRKLPTTSSAPDALTRSGYLEAMRQHLETRASTLIDICKRGGRRAK